MPKKFLSICFVALIGMMTLPVQASEWVDGDHLRARLAAVPEGGNRIAVLVLELEEGWHTYGQDPGDAGLPPHFDWEESLNVEGIEVNWPEPIRKREMDMFDVNAYEGQVSFPFNITPTAAAESVTLNLGLKVMVCNDICIPSKVELSLLLNPGIRRP